MSHGEHEYFDEVELQKLEQELRRFGTPYVSPEPEELYWAHFRTRVLDRVETPRPGLGKRMLGWIMGHPVVSGASTLVAACTVAFLLVTSSLPTPSVPHGPVTSSQLASRGATDVVSSEASSMADASQPAAQDSHGEMQATAGASQKDLAVNDGARSFAHDTRRSAVAVPKQGYGKDVLGGIGEIPGRPTAKSIMDAERQQQALTVMAAESAAQVATQSSLSAPSADLSLGELSSDELEDVYQVLLASE